MLFLNPDWFVCEGWTCRILAVLTVASALVALFNRIDAAHPLLEAITNVHAQLVVLAVVPVIGFFLLQRWSWLAVATVVLVAMILPLVPYLTASSDSRASGTNPPVAAVMQYNIFFGNDDVEAIAAHIDASGATVVALHELLPEQWEALEPHVDRYPYRIAAPLDPVDGQPGGGMALLSTAPLHAVPVDPSVSPTNRVTLAATTQIAGTETLVIGLHPHASRTDPVKVELRQRQMAGVAALARSSTQPTLILTDLNIAPTSPAYRSFLRDLAWRDPHRVVGWQSSWPTWGGRFGLPIDHIFVSNEVVLHGYRTGDGAGSDHKSVVAEISLPADDPPSG